MDPDSGLCQGCLRTLDEIARWSEMSEVEREQVVASLSKRNKAGLDVAEVPVPPLS
jgi:predicted Fe-S protein YdhL (DUF1289 family)